jgi:putative ABC transport system permease protein
VTFVSLALRNLVRRPGRTLIAAFGVALAVGSVIALVGLSRGFARAWERNLSSQGIDVLASLKGGVELMSTSIDETVGANLSTVPGVAEVTPELLDLVGLESGHSVVMSGRPVSSRMWTSLTMVEGELPRPGAGDDVAIGLGLADALGLKVGSQIPLFGLQLRVTGVVRAESAMGSFMMFTPLTSAQRMRSRLGTVTVFNLTLAPASDERRAELLRDAAQRFPQLTFTETRAIADENPLLRTASAFAWAVSAIALLMGLAAVANALLMSVNERTREIGVLSAVGWRPSRIAALITGEAIALASVGGAAGIAGGLGALGAIVRLPRLAGLIEPAVSPALVIEVVLTTIALGVIGGLYPAWRATRLAPVEALRHE